MKKLFLSSALLACLLTAAPVAYVHAGNTEVTANTEVKSALNFGVCGGLNIAAMRFNEMAEVGLAILGCKKRSGLFSAHGGIWGEYALNNPVGIRLALSYSMQGTKLEPGPVEKFSYNYLVLSPTLRIYPTSRAFGIFVGPYIGYLLTAKVKQGNRSTDMLKDLPKEKQPKRIDAGITFGTEGEHSSGIILGYGANVGLVNIIKKQEGSSADSQRSIKNFTMKFYLGYNFAKLLN